jgi:hypothetical protein
VQELFGAKKLLKTGQMPLDKAGTNGHSLLKQYA